MILSKYKYIDDPTRCARCGTRENLTKHHWKRPGALVNTPTNKRVEGKIIFLCRKCHDRVHGIKHKKLESDYDDC